MDETALTVALILDEHSAIPFFLSDISLFYRRGTLYAKSDHLFAGESLLKLRHEHDVKDAQWTKDGSHIMALSGCAVRVWDATIGKNLFQLRHESSVVGMKWNSSGSRLLTWSEDHTVRMWDASSGQELLQLRHESIVNGTQWNRYENRLLTWSEDYTVRIWDTASGQQLLQLRHDRKVISVQWGKKKNRVLTWSEDRVVRLWEVTPTDIIDRACLHASRNLTLAEWRRYIWDEPYRRTCENLPVHPSVDGDATADRRNYR